MSQCFSSGIQVVSMLEILYIYDSKYGIDWNHFYAAYGTS